MGLVVLGVSFGGVWRFRVARPSGTSSLQAWRDWVVPACRVATSSQAHLFAMSLNSCFGPIFVNLEAPVSPGYGASMQ